MHVAALWPEWLVLDGVTLTVAFVTLFVAYAIFGIAGFGSALIAAPILAHRMPVASIVPLLALFDFAAALINGVTLSDRINRRELLLLVPLMIVGSAAGVTLLLTLPTQPMSVALGVFVIAYAVYGLFAPRMRGKIARGWVWLFGLCGGVFSGLFGAGGFVYAMYLSRRLDDKEAIRATQSTMIGLSTLTRIAMFGIAGVYADLQLLVLAIAGLPALMLGLYAGHRIVLNLTHEQFLRILYVLLIGCGAALIARVLEAA